MASWNVSPHAKRLMHDYAKDEPSFTVAFATWDLAQRGTPLSRAIVGLAVGELFAEGAIELIEDGGRMGRVYAWAEPMPGRYVSSRLPELDAHRHAVIADLAPERGAPVAHTGRPHADGPTKSLKQRRRAAALKRAS